MHKISRNTVRQVLFSLVLFVPTAYADFLVCDFENDEVLLYDNSGNLISTVVQAGTSPLDGPIACELGPEGNLYVASQNNNSIFRYTFPNGQFINSFALGGSINNLEDLQFGPNGNLFAIDEGQVLRFDQITGQFLNVTLNGGAASNYRKFRFESNTSDLVIRRSNSSGAGDYTRFSFDIDDGTTGNSVYLLDYISGQASFAFGPGIGPDGDLFINDNNGSVERRDLATGAFLQTFVFNAPTDATDMEFGPNKDLFIATSDGNGGNRIDRYSGSNGLFLETFIGNLASLPNDFDFLPTPIPGDVNQDGCVDLLDVQAFVALISTGLFQEEGDINGDGTVDILDVAGFVALLTG